MRNAAPSSARSARPRTSASGLPWSSASRSSTSVSSPSCSTTLSTPFLGSSDLAEGERRELPARGQVPAKAGLPQLPREPQELVRAVLELDAEADDVGRAHERAKDHAVRLRDVVERHDPRLMTVLLRDGGEDPQPEVFFEVCPDEMNTHAWRPPVLSGRIHAAGRERRGKMEEVGREPYAAVSSSEAEPRRRSDHRRATKSLKPNLGPIFLLRAPKTKIHAAIPRSGARIRPFPWSIERPSTFDAATRCRDRPFPTSRAPRSRFLARSGASPYPPAVHELNANAFGVASRTHPTQMRRASTNDCDRWLREFNVKVVPYQDHDHLPAILRSLKAAKP